MSKRFGRNQRRKMREALADTASALEMSQGLAAHVSKKAAFLKRELDDARDIAGQMSVLFPPEELLAEHRKPPMRGEMFMVDIPRRLESLPQFLSDTPPALDPGVKSRRAPLAMLTTSIDPRALENSIHVRVIFANNEACYAVTASAWHSLTTAQRVQAIQCEIAPALARLLVKTTDLRKYT